MTRLRHLLAGALATAVGATALACTFVTNLTYLSSELDGGEGPSQGTSGAASSGGTSSGVVPDSDSGAGDAGCPENGRIYPSRVFEYFGQVPDGEAPQAWTCNLENALTENGVSAGLDRKANGSVGRARLKGELVAGCLAVEFDRTITTFRVKVGAVNDACGITPCEAGTPEGCNTSTGWQFQLFAGAKPSDEELLFVDTVSINPAMEVLPFTVPPHIAEARVIVVCRHGNVGIARDDIAVDAIWFQCRP